MKAIKLILSVTKWLVFILAVPFIGLFVLRSFLGVLLVLAGQGNAEAWMGVFASLFILLVTVGILGYRLMRSGGDRCA